LLKYQYTNKDTVTITISLPRTLKEKAEDRTVKGEFGNTSEYMRMLIRKDIEEQQKLADLRKMVNEGIEALDRGEYAVFDQDLADRIKTEGRKRLADQAQ
jgi:putative addiction module CopG family antidote